MTVIAFSLVRAATVDLAVYDLRGRRLAVLARGPRDAGAHETVWDAAGLPSGTYLVRLDAVGRVATARVSLLK